MSAAVKYIAKYWDGLCLFLTDGRIEMDSNPVERTIRPIALNRELCANLGDGGLRRRRIVAGVQPARTSRGAIRREERYNCYPPASAEIV